MRAFENGVRILRAAATNIVAATAPGLYVRLTQDTGRGEHNCNSPEDVAAYFRKCFEDYFSAQDLPLGEVTTSLAGKTILEYGPGDVLGVALLLVAHGAKKVYCVDRFPLLRHSPFNIRVIELLLESLSDAQRDRAVRCFNSIGDPASGYSSAQIEYITTIGGCSGLLGKADWIISRAVLEHVDNLDALFSDMRMALSVDGRAIHLVDLKSHGFDQENRLDFLKWAPWLWRVMYSHKGVPNRWRIDHYRALLQRHGFDVVKLEATERASQEEVAEVRSMLAPRFKSLSSSDLSWLGFWLVCRKLETEETA